MEPKKSVPVVFFQNGSQAASVDEVVVERTLRLFVDDTLRDELPCLPECLEELALGYTISMGLAAPEAVASVTVDGLRADIRLHDAAPPSPPDLLPDLPYRPSDVAENARRLLQRSTLFRETGMTHAAMLCRGGESVAFGEDIGRHNAIDKCIGKALRLGVSLGETALYTSGRLPELIVRKAVRCGIPLVVSRSGPTDAALELASRHNLTVIGFARENRMNLY